MKCCCGPKTRYTILLICGLVLIALPLALHDYINEIIKKKIRENVVIAPGSQVYDQWRKPTVPVYLQVYTFSITNPLEVQAGEAPFDVEKGPYSYKESREKFNISWGQNNVSYNQITNYTFDPLTSCAGCDPMKDEIMSVNIVYVTLMELLKSKLNSDVFDDVASILLKDIFKEGLFHTKTVHHTIWGYNETVFDDYLYLWNKLIKFVPYKYRIKLEKFLPKVPSVFILQKNPNFDGLSTVNTGQSDINQLGCYLRWKTNVGELDIWNSPYANMLNGTDGSVNRPDLSKSDILYVFTIQVCRSLKLKYLDEITIQGIDGYRFNPPKILFENGYLNPDNKGFCNPNCLPSGLLSVNACVPFNAPIVVSQPHFLNGNESLQKMIGGLSPNEADHDTFLSLEPNTGILLQALKRIQFNIQVNPLPKVSELENVQPAQIPIMWVNEKVTLDAASASKLKKNVLNNLEIIKWIEIGLFILGGLMVLIAILLFIRLCCKKKGDTHLKLIAEQGKSYGTNDKTGLLEPSLINATD